MVALAKRGIDSIALVHHHHLSFRTTEECLAASGQKFEITRTGMWARLLYTPISPAFAWHLRRIIKSAKPDVLHLHLPNPSAFWLFLLPSARGIPWVVHWHSDVITATQGWLMKLFYSLYRPFESAVLKRADAIVATSLPYRDSSLVLKNWLDKCHVVPLGVDTRRYAKPTSKEATASTSDPLQVLAVGRLTYYKGFRYLIEAAALTPGIEINLVGNGDQETQLKSLVASLKLQDRVTFHSDLSDAELARQMEMCDCLCLPSIERTEAFGMVLLEAMYFGKATIISDVEGSGMGWVVDHEITGLKVRPADPDALATALNRLANNRDELISMGRQGKEKFDRQFEINQAVAGLENIYQQVTGQPGQQQ